MFKKSRRVLVVYDSTVQWWLAYLFAIAAFCYKKLGIITEYFPATSWYTVPWIKLSGGKAFDEVHFWGHGTFGGAYIEFVNLLTALRASPYMIQELKQVIHPAGLLWLRSCSSFGCTQGHYFAEELSKILDRTVAGFTYAIWTFQSGGKILLPNEKAYWPVMEGVNTRWSKPGLPQTVLCVQNTIPQSWWAHRIDKE